MSQRQPSELSGGASSLLYGPVAITDALSGCPIAVAAGRVRAAREGDSAPRFASGWGTTFEEAARNCMHEADETYFAQLIPRDRILRACSGELAGTVIEPPAFMLFSDRQYRARRRLNNDINDRQEVPIRWSRARELDWIRSDPRFSTTEAWVPVGLCLLGYQDDSNSGVPPADSNGLATSSTVEEAVERGFCEAVERDATAIWWYNQLVMPRIDPLLLADELVSQYEAWLRSQDRELRLLQMTLDLPIPVVGAISHHGGGRGPAFGFAAGRSLREAARRAVGELAQCEANLALLKRHAGVSGTSGFTTGALRLYRWHEETNVGHHPHLSGGAPAHKVTAEVHLSWPFCLAVCRERGLEVMTVDLTHPNCGPLVRVLVPGLRSTKPRFDRGRLYDVPIRLGLKSGQSGTIHEVPFPI
jgi:thiazole/oxazole-forming peptide maturase SagD family component